MAAQERSPGSFTKALVSAAESVGILNKGSSSPDDPTSTSAISDNSLNVTRVGGLAALVASLGAAAAALFGVDKAHDAHSVVVSAYLATGAIAVAGLIAAAWIITGDARARAMAAPQAQPGAGQVAPAKAEEASAISPSPEILLLQPTDAQPQMRLDAPVEIVLIDAQTTGATASTIFLPSASTAKLRTVSLARIDRGAAAATNIDIIPSTERGNVPASMAAGPMITLYSDGQQWNQLP